MGAGTSQLTPEQIQELCKQTPFDERDLLLHLKRYAALDKSDGGVDGIAVQDVVQLTEFSGQPLVELLACHHVDDQTRHIHPQGFILMCGVLSSKETPRNKRHVLWASLDSEGKGWLNWEDMNRLYRHLLPSLPHTDSVRLANQVLTHPHATHKQHLTYSDFKKLVSDEDIERRMTADLQLSDL